MKQDLDDFICGVNILKPFAHFLWFYIYIFFFYIKGIYCMCLTILQNKITGTLTSEKNRRHIKMTAFDVSWASVEQSVQVLALFKQSSVEQEGMAHFSLLFHVEDEVPEVHPSDFLPGVLPGGGRAQPGLAAPAQPRALQENNHSWGLRAQGSLLSCAGCFSTASMGH